MRSQFFIKFYPNYFNCYSILIPKFWFRMTFRFTISLLVAVNLGLLACSPHVTSTSSKSGTSASSLKLRNEITDYAKKFVGVTYKYAGQSPGTGFDCSGFTSYVMKGFGINLSPASAAQSTTGRKIPLDRVLPGDLVFFGESEKKIQHVALVVKRDKTGITCIHSTTSRGVIVENVSTSTYWKPRLLFARDVMK
jgi:cell wall-associated NlpC family hydrolase